MNNNQELTFAKQLAEEAGKLTLQGHGQCDRIAKDSEDGYDIATKFDHKSEQLVKDRIREEFNDPVLGEEEGLIGSVDVAHERLWVVDPVDGTFNYQHGLPLYGVSIAFCQQYVPICGAIVLPALGLRFYASQGNGAYLDKNNGEPPAKLTVDPETSMEKIIIGMEGNSLQDLVNAYFECGIPRRSLRVLMCAVACLGFIASGKMNVWMHSALNVWDCAAGDILIREAGGPACVDAQQTPIFPTYLRNKLQENDTKKFPFAAASDEALLTTPVEQLWQSAGIASK